MCHRQIQFVTLLALVAVIDARFAVLDTALQGSTNEDGSRELDSVAFSKPNQGTRIMDDEFKHPGLESALGLLVMAWKGGRSLGM